MKRLALVSISMIALMLLASAISLNTLIPSDDDQERVHTESYSSHAPIFIEGDSGFTNASGVVWGSGTVSDPYVIKGWEIDAGSTSDGIYVGNTSLNFSIRDCKLYNAPSSGHAGIKLYNALHSILVGDNSSNNSLGILVSNSSDVMIADCLVSYNSEDGIYCDGVTGITITNVSARNNSFNGEYLLSCDGALIEGGYACLNGRGGVYLSSCLNSTTANLNASRNMLYGVHARLCDNQSVVNVNASFNDYGGVYFESSTNASVSGSTVSFNNRSGVYVEFSDGDVIDCLVSNNVNDGIDTKSSTGVRAIDNTICSNGRFGLILRSTCADSIVTGNDVSQNSDIGIYVSSSSNVISNNNCSYNGNSGIFLESSNANKIENNTCYSNDVDGISLKSLSMNNSLSNNICLHNSNVGVLLNNADGNDLVNNTCSQNVVCGLQLQSADANRASTTGIFGNGYGIYLTSSNGNQFQLNRIENNTNRGIYINTGSYNIVWNNTIAYNNGAGDSYNLSHNQAFDSGIYNSWNTQGSPHGFGNFWRDWTAPDDSPPWWIVDLPYDTNTVMNFKDHYPLTRRPPSVWDFAPPVTSYVITGMEGDDGWYKSVATMNLTATDVGSGVDGIFYRFGTSGGWEEYTHQVIISQEGVTEFQFYSRDKDKNEESVRNYTFKIDTGLPTCVIDSLAPIQNEPEVTLYWVGNDTVSGIGHFEISVDGDPFTAIGDISNMKMAFEEGRHTIGVRTVDVAGNIGLSDNVTFTVDTNPFSFTGPTGPWLDIVLIIVAIVAVVGVRYFQKRRRRDDSQGGQQQTGQ